MMNTSLVKEVVSESAVYGVVAISGLLVIVNNQYDAATHEVLVKVLATAGVFWLAHVYAGAVAHLGDHVEQGDRARDRLGRALRESLHHSWGMLIAAFVPLVILGSGALGLIGHEQAIWTHAVGRRRHSRRAGLPGSRRGRRGNCRASSVVWAPHC